MIEEREGAEQGEEERGSAPFDENPPVDPTESQVGNSRARFFMPSEDDQDESGDDDAGADDGEEQPDDG
jgi:hypothetical protein